MQVTKQSTKGTTKIIVAVVLFFALFLMIMGGLLLHEPSITGAVIGTSNIGIATVPTQGTPILNTTNPATNATDTNLTAYNVSTADADGNIVKNIFNWYRNGTSITVLNMPFEGINSTATNNAWDYSGFKNNGSEKGNVLWNATGGFDGRGAYEFDGTDDHINVSDSDSLRPPTTITIAAWVKPRASQSAALVDKISFGGSDGYAFNLIFGLAALNIGNSAISGSTTLPVGAYTHIAGVYDGSQILIYVNGVEDGSGPKTGAIPANSSQTLQIGLDHGGNNDFNGAIDEVMIFNRSLSADQIFNLYANRTDEIASAETIVHETWNVSITPNDGNDDGGQLFSNTVTIRDSTSPIVIIVNPAFFANLSSGLQAFNASVTDTESPIDKVFFMFTTNTTPFNITATAHASNNFGADVNLSTIIEGTHIVTVFANDTVNNVDNTRTIPIDIDRTAPNITIATPANGQNYSVNSFNQTFNVSLRDPGALTDVKNATFAFDNASGTGFNVTAVNGSGYWAASYNVSGLAEGSHVVRIYTYDFVGNLNNTETITFDVDFTAPNITPVTPTNGQNFSVRSFNQTFNVSLRDPDSLTDVKNATFAFDNSSGTGFNVTAVNGSGYWAASYNVSGLAEGSHVVQMYTYDFAGNLNNTETINFTVDLTAPTVTITAPSDSATISGTRDFSATVQDSITEVNTVIFEFSGGITSVNRTASNSSGTWTVNLDTTTLEEGSLTVKVFANDTVNNMNSTETISLDVDNIPTNVGGGGTGSGSAGKQKIYFLNLTAGEVIKKVIRGEIYRFLFEGVEHSILIANIKPGEIGVTITSVIINQILMEGVPEQFDVNEDGIKDLELQNLHSTSSLGNMSFKLIPKLIEPVPVEESQKLAPEDEEKPVLEEAEEIPKEEIPAEELEQPPAAPVEKPFPLVGKGFFQQAVGAAKDYSIYLIIITLVALLVVGMLFAITRSQKGKAYPSRDKELERMDYLLEQEIAGRLTTFSYEDNGLARSRIEAVKALNEMYFLDTTKISELNRYITQKASKGANQQEIIADLVGEGWSKAVIEPYVLAHYE